MRGRLILAVIVGGLPLSCEAAAPWLSIQPLSVVSILPGEGLVGGTDFDRFTITYSSGMNRGLTEAATRLRENGDSVSLVYTWEDSDRRLHVRPVQGFSTGKAYELELGTGTEDASGNSLAQVRKHRVATRAVETDLLLSASIPADNSDDVAIGTPLVLDFSNSLDRVTVLDALSLTPTVSLLYEYANDDRRLTLTPVTQWASDTRYRLRITTALRDTQGNALNLERELRFRTAARPPAELQQLVSDGGHTMKDTSLVYSNNNPAVFEADVTFAATFSPPRSVTASERIDAVSIRPAVDLDLTWASDGLSAAIAFGKRLKWQTEYVLTVLKQEFRFQVDGPNSVPPSLARVVYVEDVRGTSPQFSALTYGESLTGKLPTSSPPDKGAFDLYIQHAPGTTIPLDSALQALSTSVTNGGLTIDVQAVEIIPAATAGTTTPQPNPLPTTNQTVLRYIGDFSDNSAVFGTLTLKLGTDLHDALGNAVVNEIEFLLNG